MAAWRIGVLMALLLGLTLVWTGCEYVEGKDSDGTFPSVQMLIKDAERLELEPDDYAGRLYRGRQQAIEDRYDRRIENASGTRLERLMNEKDREMDDLDYEYRRVCLKLERRGYGCDSAAGEA